MEQAQATRGTRLKILELAQDLLRAHGYKGFSYSHIAQKLGVKNAAIHYHFPSKEDLGVDLINRERRRFAKWIARKEIRELDAWGQLEWFLSIYEHYSQGGTRVCYLGALESSFGDLPSSIQSEARALHAEMLEWLTTLLAGGRQSGHFAFPGQPANKAALMMSALQGAIQFARVNDAGNLAAVIEQIKSDLNSN